MKWVSCLMKVIWCVLVCVRLEVLGIVSEILLVGWDVVVLLLDRVLFVLVFVGSLLMWVLIIFLMKFWCFCRLVVMLLMFL